MGSRSNLPIVDLIYWYSMLSVGSQSNLRVVDLPMSPSPPDSLSPEGGGVTPTEAPRPSVTSTTCSTFLSTILMDSGLTPSKSSSYSLSLFDRPPSASPSPPPGRRERTHSPPRVTIETDGTSTTRRSVRSCATSRPPGTLCLRDVCGAFRGSGWVMEATHSVKMDGDRLSPRRSHDMEEKRSNQCQIFVYLLVIGTNPSDCL